MPLCSLASHLLQAIRARAADGWPIGRPSMNCRIEKISERRSYGEIGNAPRCDHRQAKAGRARAAQQWLIPSEPSRIEKSIRRARTLLQAMSLASGTRDLAVRFDSKTNGTGTLRQFVSKATRPSSRVAFCYLRSVLSVSSKGRLSARLPEIDGSHPVPQAQRDPLIEQVGHSIDFRAH
jgi:hypothetical protein